MIRAPWSDVQVARYCKRVALFVRRGWDRARAEHWAVHLALRDAERDGRRL